MIIGYTTGVYDMFHIGHLNLLKAAKEKCDYLICGVNTDELVVSYKNKKPIIPFKERIKIVESIKFVDKTVPVNDRNKVKAWEIYKFNICFVGDDWKGSEIFNRIETELKALGVKIEYLPYTKGISSSILREKLGTENLNSDASQKIYRGG